MKLSELISRLTQLRDEHGPDVEVWSIWDGEPRSLIDHAWMARDKSKICMAEANDVVYSNESRPEWASNEHRWMTPKIL